MGGFEASFAPSVMGTASKSQGSGCGGHTPGSSLKLLQDFPGSCFQTCHSPAFIQCRMMQSQFKQPSCTVSSHTGRVSSDVTWHRCVDLDECKTHLH